MTELEMNRSEKPLESWKEIAAYLKRDVRTVRRWEKSEGLPVHRQMHQARGSVFAYPSELEAWKSSRELRLTAPPPITPWRRAASTLSFSLAMLLTLVSMASGPILNPTIASAQGTVNRQVWSGLEFSNLGPPSPDGQLFPCTDWETGGDVAICDIVTGKKRRLTNRAPDSLYSVHDTPFFSPDGKQIAYAWSKMYSSQELRVVGLDGSKPQVVFSDESLRGIVPSGWSPDGKSVLVSSMSKQGHTSRLAWAAIADGSLREVKTFDSRYPFSTRLSPDGRFIAYDLAVTKGSENHDIYVVSSDGGNEIPLVQHAANDYPLAWTPDGGAVLFASDRSGSWDAWMVKVADGRPQGAPVIVKKDIGRVSALGFARNGSLFYSVDASQTELNLAAVDTGTGKVVTPPAPVSQHFVGSNTDAAWSPDGQNLAYLSIRGPAWAGAAKITLRIRSLQTGEERELSPKLHNLSGTRWFPDGLSIAVSGYDLDDHQGLYRIDVQTGEVSPIVRGQDGTYLYSGMFSANGKTIFYCRGDNVSGVDTIQAHDLATGRETEIYRTNSAKVWNVNLSPDGRHLTFTLTKRREWSVLCVMPSAGGQPRELLKLEKPEMIPFETVSWTPDGRNLIFAKGKWLGSQPDFKSELWRIPAAGGTPQKLELAGNSFWGLRFHPDGKRVVYDTGTWSSEVWVMENFLPGGRKLIAR